MRELYYIDAHALEQNIAKGREALKQVQSSGGEISLYIKQRQQLQLNGNIAFVDVKGVLADNEAPLHELLGGTDYRSLLADLEQAEASGVDAIVLTIDSPGGAVAGNKEVVNAIKEIHLPVVAFVDGQACSAAYNIAAASDLIVIRESSVAGNVGAMLSFMSYASVLESQGLKLEVFTNDGASYKAISPLSHLTDEQRQFLQDSINEAGQDFLDTVRANRPDIDDVYAKAGWYRGGKAVELGFVDTVGSLQDAISLAESIAKLG